MALPELHVLIHLKIILWARDDENVKVKLGWNNESQKFWSKGYFVFYLCCRYVIFWFSFLIHLLKKIRTNDYQIFPNLQYNNYIHNFSKIIYTSFGLIKWKWIKQVIGLFIIYLCIINKIQPSKFDRPIIHYIICKIDANNSIYWHFQNCMYWFIWR